MFRSQRDRAYLYLSVPAKGTRLTDMFYGELCIPTLHGRYVLQAILEKERIEHLIAGRRQREAKLVGDFASDTIYDLEVEERLSMHQAQRESRGRIEELCKRKKLYASAELITNDLIQELQTYLARYIFILSFVRMSNMLWPHLLLIPRS